MTNPMKADGDITGKWMESLGFEKRKTSSDFIAYFPTSKDANIGMVRLDQAAFFHQQFQSEKAKAALDARIDELTYIRAFSGQPYAMSDINDRPLTIKDRIKELSDALKQGPTNAK